MRLESAADSAIVKFSRCVTDEHMRTATKRYFSEKWPRITLAMRHTDALFFFFSSPFGKKAPLARGAGHTSFEFGKITLAQMRQQAYSQPFQVSGQYPTVALAPLRTMGSRRTCWFSSSLSNFWLSAR